ncbi:Cupin domain-containing protein [Rhodovulum sp. ES.010]|uniref:cupin domain-containing protein n=1 Tax=Rhodovulum sp. ES.010 TaxID=1882821 RepID=UPI00092A2E0D|nr:cupin domain-containing protein [Rhodovulum sp. ES.010]SIO39974.1 Cupin domain-containing protein [Rhodovulum sp. ES.010]
MRPDNFFNLDNAEGGRVRELAPGISAPIFTGERAMVSIVRFAPNTRGVMHDHPEEQWGSCVAGGGTRFQGDDAVPVSPGDFWRTPGGVRHTMEAGDEGLVVMDVFAPPRKAYETPGSGFGA